MARRQLEFRASLFLKILLATLLAAVLPLLLVSVSSYNGVQEAKTAATRAATTGLDDKALSGLEMQATLIAGQISQLLNSSVQDVRTAALLPRTDAAYMAFYRAHKSTLWLPDGTAQGRVVTLPLYREMSYIDATGQERILIRDDALVPADHLVNVRNPANTTYKTETYFAQTKALPPRAVYVSHLLAWYATNPAQPAGLADASGKPGAWYAAYVGVVRFALPLQNSRGGFAGMVMLSLDARQIMEHVIHITPGSATVRVPFPDYASGNYAFMWDDQGWLIEHPLLGRLRGFDSAGTIPSQFMSSMSAAERLRHPFNMATSAYTADNLIEYRQTMAHKVGYRISHSDTGVPKANVYAPILFSAGSYAAHGVFGGIILGAGLTGFQQASALTGSVIASKAAAIQHTSIVIAGGALVFIVILAALVSLNISRPIARLALAARAVGQGKWAEAMTFEPAHQLIADEVTDLAQAFKHMALQVNQREQTLKAEVTQLHIQIDLQKQQKQVAEIVDTDYFRMLSANAATMRRRMKESPEEGA